MCFMTDISDMTDVIFYFLLLLLSLHFGGVVAVNQSDANVVLDKNYPSQGVGGARHWQEVVALEHSLISHRLPPTPAPTPS